MNNYRVHLIGSGYESMKFYIVEASTYADAMNKAEGLALNEGKVIGIDYCELYAELYF